MNIENFNLCMLKVERVSLKPDDKESASGASSSSASAAAAAAVKSASPSQVKTCG